MPGLHAGVLSAEDKQVLSSQETCELGIRFDGKQGLLGCFSKRLLKMMWVTIHLLGQHGGTKKEIQIVLGRWILILFNFEELPWACSRELGKR